MGDYNGDSSGEENFNLLLCLTQVEANVDLKRQGGKVSSRASSRERGVRGFHNNS